MNQDNQSQQQTYYPPTSQSYQSKILIYEANSLIGHRLVEYFRNDHIIQTNPNVIIGTVNPSIPYANSLELDLLVPEDNQKMMDSAIVQSDIVLFPLDTHNTPQLEHLLKLLKCTPESHHKTKVIVISPIFAWKNRHNQDQPLKTEDFPNRKPINSTIHTLENLCLGLHTFNPQLSGCVISRGLVYGWGEETLFPLFKQALQQKKALKIYGRGNNHIPTIHVDDLSQLCFDIAFDSNRNGFFYGVDLSSTTQKQLIKSIAETIGNGKVQELPIEEGLLEEHYDIWASDIQVEVKAITKISQWKCQEGLVKNMGIVVGQFNTARGLKPNKILIHGTPASGKSQIASILSKNYGLPVLTIKQLIQDIKDEQSQFANQIKAKLQELKAIKVEEEKKAYEQLKKKKKGKGMDQFNPDKVIPRLEEADVCRIVKRRMNMADCLNKGYIIDGILKTYSACETVFNDQNGEPVQAIMPNSVFSVEGTQEETKERIKKLAPQSTQGTHLTEEHTSRRFNAYKVQNDVEKWDTFFEGKVDIKQVPFEYPDSNEFIHFVERNGPLGFKSRPTEQEQAAEPANEQKEAQENKEKSEQRSDEGEEEEAEEAFDLQKLTENQVKILNEKSRPIRQYLIDNVIPQITQGLLEICKQTPPDPIKYLINFLQNKKSKKKRSVRKI